MLANKLFTNFIAHLFCHLLPDSFGSFLPGDHGGPGANGRQRVGQGLRQVPGQVNNAVVTVIIVLVGPSVETTLCTASTRSGRRLVFSRSRSLILVSLGCSVQTRVSVRVRFVGSDVGGF